MLDADATASVDTAGSPTVLTPGPELPADRENLHAVVADQPVVERSRALAPSFSAGRPTRHVDHVHAAVYDQVDHAVGGRRGGATTTQTQAREDTSFAPGAAPSKLGLPSMSFAAVMPATCEPCWSLDDADVHVVEGAGPPTGAVSILGTRS